MPKTINTRRQRAAELFARLERGPAFTGNFDGSPFTPEQAIKDYQLWSKSWILNELKVLVPELREKKAKL